ncbi:hypothetical protein ACSS7Z_05170 [Microbacterium sp. A82]
MTTLPSSDATANVQPLTAPAGLNLLGDAEAGSCCGGSCSTPAE